jgi:hypothetical protein
MPRLREGRDSGRMIFGMAIRQYNQRQPIQKEKNRMKIKQLPIVLGLLALILSVLACGGSFSTANISDSWMASDVDGEIRTTVFSQSDIFYAFVELSNAPDDTLLKAVWTGVELEGEEPNLVIDETEFTSDDGIIYFELSNDQLWPVGSYKVDIYLNEEMAVSMNFEVR